MESVAIKSPKDDKILNKDDSVTNEDNLIKTDEIKGAKNNSNNDVTPVNDNPELYDESATSSNKGQGPAGENL